MITLIISIILGIIYQTYKNRDFLKSEKKKSYFLYEGVVGAFKGLVGGCIVAMIFTLLLPSEAVQDRPIELVSMRTQESLSGTFLFGSGQIGSKVTYRFMKRSADGFMTVDTVTGDANSSIRIKEEATLKNTGNLVITRSRKVATSWFARYFTFGQGAGTYELSKDFHVPVGTVVQEFKVQ